MVRSIGGSARRIDLDETISRFLAWSPDGSALIAVAEGPGRSSYLVPLDDPVAAPIPLWLEYDTDRRQSGGPQWSPARPADPPGPPSVAGTALDPAAKGPLAESIDDGW